MIRKRITRNPIKRTCRKKVGKWAVLGLHGGQEGEQWTKGKKAVAGAAGELRTAEHGIKAKYMSRISRLGKLNRDDKQRLINEIERM